MLLISNLLPSASPTGNGRPMDETYKVGPVLGKGGFGTVYSGWRVRDGLPVAIKQVARAKITAWEMVSCVRCFFYDVRLYMF